MALTPMIVIGTGGSGGKVVAGLRHRIGVELRRRGWTEGIPEAWQLLYVDTPAAQEVNLEFGAALPAGDYISTAARQTRFSAIDESVARHAGNHDALDRLAGWRPAHDLRVPVSTGAGQWRAVGRTVAFHGLDRVADRVRRSLNSCQAGTSQLQRLGEVLGDDAKPAPTPFVVIVSSMAGGTGAGILVDVADVVRAVDPGLDDRIMSMLFTAEVFQDLKSGTGLQPNTVGVLSELMSGYFDRNSKPEQLFTGLVDMQQHAETSSGPSYPFVLGMSTMSGTNLQNISDCYRAATETLASAMTTPRVFKDLLEFQITNWVGNALPNMSSWEFGNPPNGDGTYSPAGCVSSFGSARLSVGSTLFGEYAVHRMGRDVVEFLLDGFLVEGRERLQDPTATREEVLQYFRAERGLAFVEASGLHELNDDGGENDQVLEVLLPTDALTALMRAWVNELTGELLPVGAAPKATWINAIGDLVQRRVAHVTNPTQQQIDQGIRDLATALPQQLLQETARVMSELGVPVAGDLLAYAEEHIAASVTQLRNEAIDERQRATHWREEMGRALIALDERDKVDAHHELVAGAVKQATRLGFHEARAMGREQTAEFLELFARQVLKPLRAHLDQIAATLGDTELRSEVAKFPNGGGVPLRFAPTPLDYTLIDVDEWPKLYTDLVRETASSESDERYRASNPIGTMRRMVGAGGFEVHNTGRPQLIPSALEVAADWSMDRAIEFTTRLKLDDVMERSREWMGRHGTRIGDFVRQDLESYLSPTDHSGQAIANHGARITKFRDQLARATTAATPLVAIDPTVFDRVHPHSSLAGAMTTLNVQPLPVTGPARAAAEDILTPFVDADKTIGSFFTDTSTHEESVLIVSQLAGAVHPSAVKSLTGPIATAWSRAKVSPQMVDAFWQYRRARILPEFVPVAPVILNSMIKGYFVGRAFGAVPSPEAHGKLIIGDGRGKVDFIWPVLRWGKLGDRLLTPQHQRDWLPALLESLALAYMLVPTEPGILDGYEAMYQLGVNASQRMDAWLATGSIRESLDTPRILHTGDRETDVTALHGSLKKVRDQYQSRIDGTRLSADPDEFYSVEYGYSLYPAIVSALNELIQEIPSPDAGEMEL